MSQAPLILYADDDIDDQGWLKEAIERHLPTVKMELFGNGIDLLKRLHQCQPNEQPCLIILDINMPGISGKEVLRDIRENPDGKDLKVVLFSTSTSELDNVYAREHGSRLITKPLTVEQFDFIGKYLAHYCWQD